MTQVSLSELKQRQVQAAPVEVGFGNVEGFMALQRMANMFTQSSIVPDTFRGQQNIGNACIALEMALRMHANPLMVMQSIFVVHGRPSWSAQFLIATLNKSGRFSALRYVFTGEEGTDAWGCRAVATELATGEHLEGPLITIGLAKKEGWYSKNGSKWQSMPELMLRYRAASWFVRAYAPEIAMGLPEQGELEDTVIDVTPEPVMTTEAVKEKATRSRRKKDPEPAQEVESVVEEVVEQVVPQEPEAAPAEAVPPVDNPSTPPAMVECPDRDGLEMSATFCNTKCATRKNCPAWPAE